MNRPQRTVLDTEGHTAARETFQCDAMGGRAVMSRVACGGRYANQKDPSCIPCVVGKAHRAGKRPDTWPDGSQIVVVSLKPAVPHVPPSMRPKMRKKRAST